jgi:hypothetical protein
LGNNIETQCGEKSMNCLTKVFACTAIAIAACSFAPPSANAQRMSWDTSFIAENAFFVGGLNVEGLLRLEPEDSELRVKLTELIEAESGMKIEELRQMQFVMAGEKVELEEDTFEVKFLFNKDQDFDFVFDKMFAGDRRHEDAEHQGKKYYRSKNARLPSLYMPDKQTLIVASQPRMLEVIENETGKGTIVDRLANADGEAQAFVAFEYNDQLDAFVQEIAQEMRGLPFDIADIAAEAKSGQLILILDQDEPIVAHIEAKNAEGAERLQRAMEALIALGKVGIPMAREQMKEVPDFGDAEQKAMIQEMMESAAKGLDTAEALLEGATVETDEQNVEFKTKVMGGVYEGARFLVRAMFMGVAVRSEIAPLPPAAIEVEVEKIQIEE